MSEDGNLQLSYTEKERFLFLVRQSKTGSLPLPGIFFVIDYDRLSNNELSDSERKNITLGPNVILNTHAA